MSSIYTRGEKKIEKRNKICPKKSPTREQNLKL
jgi:hypothetical protein